MAAGEDIRWRSGVTRDGTAGVNIRRVGKAKRAHHFTHSKNGGHVATLLCPPYETKPPPQSPRRSCPSSPARLRPHRWLTPCRQHPPYARAPSSSLQRHHAGRAAPAPRLDQPAPRGRSSPRAPCRRRRRRGETGHASVRSRPHRDTAMQIYSRSPRAESADSITPSVRKRSYRAEFVNLETKLAAIDGATYPPSRSRTIPSCTHGRDRSASSAETSLPDSPARPDGAWVL